MNKQLILISLFFNSLMYASAPAAAAAGAGAMAAAAQTISPAKKPEPKAHSRKRAFHQRRKFNATPLPTHNSAPAAAAAGAGAMGAAVQAQSSAQKVELKAHAESTTFPPRKFKVTRVMEKEDAQQTSCKTAVLECSENDPCVLTINRIAATNAQGVSVSYVPGTNSSTKWNDPRMVKSMLTALLMGERQARFKSLEGQPKVHVPDTLIFASITQAYHVKRSKLVDTQKTSWITKATDPLNSQRFLSETLHFPKDGKGFIPTPQVDFSGHTDLKSILDMVTCLQSAKIRALHEEAVQRHALLAHTYKVFTSDPVLASAQDWYASIYSAMNKEYFTSPVEAFKLDTDPFDETVEL